jgi:hypothetical protein
METQPISVPVATAVLRERLLTIMDRKTHPAWNAFGSGEAPRAAILSAYQQEWEVYMRDFPVLLARVLGNVPPDLPGVRVHLAETLYEEQTGGMSRSAPHTALFLRLMTEGLGAPRVDFEQVTLTPASRGLRDWLDEVTQHRDSWIPGAAVLGIFMEGSAQDRAVLDGPRMMRTQSDVDERVTQHPLVRHYKVPRDAMEAARVHLRFDPIRRHDAWKMVLDHAKDEDHDLLAKTLETTLDRWLTYRGELATWK